MSKTKALSRRPGSLEKLLDWVTVSPSRVSGFRPRVEDLEARDLWAPIVTGVLPNNGLVTGGTVITLTGTEFAGASVVNINGSLANINSVSATQIVATTASQATPGTYDVIVTATTGTSTNNGTLDDFTYNPNPTINAVNGIVPASGTPSGGTVVTINGTGFLPGATVQFGTAAPVAATTVTSTSITVTTPPGSGAVNVVVTNPDGGFVTKTSGYNYTVVNPSISVVNPASGTPAGGTVVTITGTGFLPGATVQFGTAAPVAATTVTSTSITVTTPTAAAAGGPGLVNVKVINQDTGSATVNNGYNYLLVNPTINMVGGIVPSSGTPAGGTVVTINGTGFLPGATVQFGTTAAVVPTTITGTSITVTTPAAGGQTLVNVKVTNPDTGSFTATGGYNYTIVNPTINAVGGIAPASGTPSGGTVVTITGTGFLPGATVQFGTTAPVAATTVTSTSITVTTPAAGGQTLVNVKVTNPDTGFFTATNGYNYQIVNPTINMVGGIVPSSGTPSGGTVVTINGTGFLPGATVKFGIATVVPTTITSTSITVTTPTAAAAGGAGLVNVLVANTDGGSAQVNNGYNYTIVNPSISAVNPASGSPLGGTVVTITGTGFLPGATVQFGTTAPVAATTVTSTSITVTTPAAGGQTLVNVKVTNPDTGFFTATNGYNYQIVNPTVSLINPGGGLPAGGTVVTITGTGFVAGATVKFGAAAPVLATTVTGTSITVTAPANPLGAANVLVGNPDGGSVLVTGGFLYAAAPTVGGVLPGTGSMLGGTTITITGTNFYTGAIVTMVGAPTVQATNVVVVNSTTITATTPAHAAGFVDVVVSTASGNSLTSAADGFTYVAVAAPTVTAVSPNSGPIAGGTSITITGTNLTGASAVTIGGAAATSFTVVNATTITAVTPAHAAGVVDVVVTTPGGPSATSPADQFTYTTAPTVTAVSPNSGPLAGGTSITITGTNLTGAMAVTIGGTAATSFTVVNATTITAVTPTHAAGVVDVTVTTPTGTSATSAADQFTYSTAPTVTAVSPNSGPIAGGTAITITGTNFTGATAVTIGGSVATSFTVVNATTITAVTPAHAVGIVDVTVTTPSGTSALVAADKFTYAAAPTVTAVSPNSGPLTGGTSITITGTNFTGATAVTVGGVAATSVVVVNATTITATTPAHAAGLVDVTVTTPSGTSPTSAADKFTYSTVPSVTAVSPSTGPSTGGTSITITGTNFTGTTGVTVGGVAATGVVVVNATTITATTPAHAVGLVDVIVTTPNGTSAITAADNFTYVVAPTVTAVSPNIGPIAGGTAITITGTNFTGATVVTVGGVAATSVVVVSATSITAVTPAHAAGLVDVIVTTPGGPSATSAADKFNYDSTGPTVTIGTPSAATTATGPVTYTITYADANFNASTLTAANVTLNKTGTANGIVSVDSGTGTTRTVTISGITGDGTLGISLAAGTANDTAGNQAPAAGPSTTFVVSNLASFAVGDVGGAVRMVNALTGDVVSLVRPLDTATSQYKGLVEVALGRFNGDGIDDLAVAAADPLGVNGLSASKSGKVFIYDGAALATGTLTLIRTFTPFATHDGPDVTGGPYFNGLNIALGDVNGDNQIDLIAGTRGGNGTTAGLQEYGRLVVIDGNSPSGLNNVIGGIQTPFGSGYQKGVIVAAGNVDGLGGDEIAVTRGGPVASSNPAVQQIKVKVLQLQGGALAELPLAANGSTAFAPFGSLSGPANAISRDGRVAFVDSNGDGKDELVFSALDPLTNPANEQVRVGVYSINVSASLGAASIVSTGPDQGTYRTGVAVVDHSTTHVAATGLQQNLALLTQSASPGVVYLAPLTGASLGGFGLSVLDGGIAIAGI